MAPDRKDPTDYFDVRNAQDHPSRRFRARGAARFDARPTSPRRSAPGSPRRRSPRASTASCATSPARSRATPASRWSPSRDEADALELARHDYAHVLAEAVQALFPGTQITFGPSTDDGFYYDFAPPRRGPSPTTTCRRSRREMREIIAADKPLTREVWDARRADRALAARRARPSRPNGPPSCPQGEELTVYRSVGSGEALARHVPRAAPALDRQARSRRLQADARRRAPIGAATRRTRCFSASTAPAGSTRSSSTRTSTGSRKRPSATTASSARRWTCSTSSPRRTAAVFWHPKGYLIWRELEAYMRRATRRRRLRGGQDPAAHGRAPVGAVRPLGQVPREHVRHPRRGAATSRTRGRCSRARPTGWRSSR